MSQTSAILKFGAAPHVLPPQVRADALRLLGDTLAVMAAGAASDEAARLRSALARGNTSNCPQPIPNPVRAEPVEAPLAAHGASTGSARTGLGWVSGSDNAFTNGFAIHCLEWDAVHEPAVVHALSVVTAALLARSKGSDPEAFLTALAVGVDVASGLGIAATGSMRFFRPATAGVIGAALAVARLEGMTRTQMADVLGLAYSFAGGTMQAHAEASVALPLQIGRAAQAAVQAVNLVRAGLTGPHDVLEGPFGYSALIEPLDLARYNGTLGQVWRISEVSVKPFPSGRASHGALGVLQELHGSDVQSIDLYAPPLIHRLVGRPFEPAAPLSYQRLSLPFLAPLLLRDGHIDPRLTETVPELAAKVSIHVDGNPDGNAMNPQRLVVTLKSGEVIERQIPATLGSPAAPMSAAQSAAKYALCRELAGPCDPRLFDDPLAYAVDPA